MRSTAVPPQFLSVTVKAHPRHGNVQRKMAMKTKRDEQKKKLSELFIKLLAVSIYSTFTQAFFTRGRKHTDMVD
jgi:hypothetical protein